MTLATSWLADHAAEDADDAQLFRCRVAETATEREAFSRITSGDKPAVTISTGAPPAVCVRRPSRELDNHEAVVVKRIAAMTLIKISILRFRLWLANRKLDLAEWLEARKRR